MMTRGDGKGEWPAYLIIAILGVPLTLMILASVLPIDRIATTFYNDDGFFYLVIARNQASHHFSTFDGTELTNGYHPLWMAFLTPLFYLPIGKDLACRLAVIFSLLLFAGAGTLLARSIRAHGGGNGRAAIAVSLLYLLVAISGWYGLESPLAAFCITVFVVTSRDAASSLEAERPAGPLLTAGIFGAASILARLDSTLLVAPMLVSLAFSTRSLRRAVLVGGPALIALGGFLVASKALFGHAMPISGVLKSGFPHLRLPAMGLTDARWGRVVLTAVVLGLPMAAILLRRRGAGGDTEVHPAVEHAWACGLVGGFAHLVYDLAFQRDADWSLMPWHFAASLALGVTIAGFVVPMPRRRGWATVLVAAAVVLGPMAAFTRLGPFRTVEKRMMGLMNCARWLERHPSPPDTSVAVTDPGIVAYFSGHTTVSLDGLINNYRYQQILANGELPRYLEEKHVDYVVVVDRGVAAENDEYVLDLRSLLYGGSSRAHFPKGSRIEGVAQTRSVGIFRWASKSQPRALVAQDVPVPVGATLQEIRLATPPLAKPEEQRAGQPPAPAP